MRFHNLTEKFKHIATPGHTQSSALPQTEPQGGVPGMQDRVSTPDTLSELIPPLRMEAHSLVVTAGHSPMTEFRRNNFTK